MSDGHYDRREISEVKELIDPAFSFFSDSNDASIIRCESDDKYTKIFLTDKKMILASRNLGEFEDLLKAEGFALIHHSDLINIKHLTRYIKGEGGQVVMDDDTVLNVSRRKKDDLLRMVSQFR